jgi:hypothetical protein
MGILALIMPTGPSKGEFVIGDHAELIVIIALYYVVELFFRSTRAFISFAIGVVTFFGSPYVLAALFGNPGHQGTEGLTWIPWIAAMLATIWSYRDPKVKTIKVPAGPSPR